MHGRHHFVFGALLATLAIVAPLHADPISYGYNFLTPTAVTGDAGNLGAVSFSTTPAGHLTGNAVVTAAKLAAASSAPESQPDTFSGQSYSLTLQLTDGPSGQSGALTFVGSLTGTLSAADVSVTTKFDSPTKTLFLGGDMYTVTVGPFTFDPNPTVVGTLQATINVAAVASPSLAPEPSTIVMAGLGAAAVMARRRHE